MKMLSRDNETLFFKLRQKIKINCFLIICIGTVKFTFEQAFI